MAGQYRNWCLTLNNFTAGETVIWTTLADEGDVTHRISYFVFQSEVSDTGTPHYQGYVEFKRPTRLLGVRRIFSMRVHAERRVGSSAQATHYCKKPVPDCICDKCYAARHMLNDGRSVPPFSGEFGRVREGAGRPKGDFAKVIARIRDGVSTEDIEDEFPATIAMYPDKIADYRLHLLGKRDWAIEIEIFVGPTGTGKSFTARDENPGYYVVDWPKGQRWWWPGYAGQECVILDEWRHQVKMDVFLGLFDRYEFGLESKGRSFQFVSKKLVITTNLEPRDWFPNLSNEVLEPLARRIRDFAEIFDFANDGVYPNFPKVRRTDTRQFAFNHRDFSQFNASQ